MAARATYPPCASGTDARICAQGYKFTWPELVRKTEAEAKTVIVSENPLVTVVSLSPGTVGFPDFCCNRVYLVIDANKIVTRVPQIY